jgi:hypothetical protein
MLWLKQSTAVTLSIGPFVSSSDGFTAQTGLALVQSSIRLSKNGAAYAQKGDSTAPAHQENGYYSCVLNTTDTGTLGVLRLAVNFTGALPVWLDCMVVTANIWDSHFGAGALSVTASAIAANAITASAIQADAITAAKIADGAIDAATFAAGAINAAAIATDAITAAKVADGTIDANTFAASAITATAIAANAITAAKIATDAIGAAQLAADAGAEIADAVWDEATSGHAIAGSTGKLVSDIKTETASLQADTDNLQTRLPTALVSGRIDASVGAMGADVVTAAAIANGAIDAATFAAGAIDSTAIATDAISSAQLSASSVTEIAAAIKALVVETAGNYTLGQVLSLALAVLAGRSSASAGTYSTPDGSATRVAATVDASGNRTSMTLTPSA